MLIDANDLPENSGIDCDICIAGSGPAGITIASELAGSGMKVCLIESGGLPHEDPVQASIVAEQVGLPVDVVKFRNYMFGGASNLWGGVRRRWLRLRPMDPLDFEARPWLPDSGWPLTYEDLVPYFERAGKIFGLLCCTNFSADAHREKIASEFHNGDLRTAIFQVTRPTQFGKVYAGSLAASHNVHVYLHARVIEVEEHATSPFISCLHVVTPGGVAHRIVAKRFVLACGGLENARLLLASQRKAAAGIGNSHDVAGRYYMQHPKGIHGLAILRRKALRSSLYTGRRMNDRIVISGGLSFSEDFQRKEEVLNHCILFRPAFILSESPASEAYRAFLRSWHSPRGKPERFAEFLDAVSSAATVLGGTLRNGRVGAVFRVANHMEQMPRAESRLGLSRQKDQFGVPQLRTDWRINDVEKRSLRRLHELVRSKLAPGDAGELESNLDPLAERWPVVQDSAHHLGATRMHDDPRRGVTNANCGVHGLHNLYMAGGSVFPTSGYANPTFTIVALAIRLADHLKEISRSV
jgi:choline dehydrogenase-like flavoprotein